MQEYVTGFLFDEAKCCVLLIEKLRPKWQAGTLNGVGGKIEEGETPRQAMVREFYEECGIRVDEWGEFATLQGNGVFKVHFFWGIGKPINARQKTDERLVISDTSKIQTNEKVNNQLKWLIPMALGMAKERAYTFEISERY